MKKILAGALLAATLGLGLAATFAPAPASAQGIVITPQGVRVYPWQPDYNRYDRRYRRDIDRRDAVEIARHHGVGRVWNVDRRGARWVVTGDARRGAGGLRVAINARTGNVISMDRVRR